MYEKQLDKILWSFSTLSSYDECPYQFYLNKIEHRKEKDKNFYSDSGTIAHELLSEIISGKLKLEDSVESYIERIDEVGKIYEQSVDKKMEQFADYLTFHSLEDIEQYNILGVEKKVLFKINQYRFIGFIDLLLEEKDTGRLVVVDHKSSGKFLQKNGKPYKNKEAQFNTYKKQMYLYCKAVKDEYGKFPKQIVWNHFYDDALTKIPFNEKEYIDTLAWANETIEKIYKDVEFLHTNSYFMCSKLCDFRNSCEYREEEMNE